MCNSPVDQLARLVQDLGDKVWRSRRYPPIPTEGGTVFELAEWPPFNRQLDVVLRYLMAQRRPRDVTTQAVIP
jgi:hypothetical protein